MKTQYRENARADIATSQPTGQPPAQARIGAIAPQVPVPPEGYFQFKDVVQHGVKISIPLSRGIVINDKLLFALSSDGTLLYTYFHFITPSDFNNGVIELHISGEGFAYSAGRTVHFAYNIQHNDTVIMVSSSVDVPVRA